MRLFLFGFLVASASTFASAIGLLKRRNCAREELTSRFNLMFNIMRAFMLIMAAGFCFLFGWIIRRLIWPPIKAEFPGSGEEPQIAEQGAEGEPVNRTP